MQAPVLCCVYAVRFLWKAASAWPIQDAAAHALEAWLASLQVHAWCLMLAPATTQSVNLWFGVILRQ